MQITQAQVILMLGLFALGFILGAVLAWVLSGRQKEDPAKLPADPWQQLRSRFTERASLWQEQSSGKLFVRMDDQMVSGADQLTETQRKTLNTAMKDWLAWMGFPGAKSSVPTPAPEAAPAEPNRATAPATPLPEEAKPASPQAQPAQNKPDKPMSIVEQIDEILQEKLKTSAIQNKGVRLSEDPREGVMVWIGLEHFIGIDAVTDPEVRALVRSAVMEWEKRQSPGNR
jgi:hypothetical protein